MAAAGISFAAFVVAVAARLTYYQFTYVPEVNTKPTFPPSILASAEPVGVKIVRGVSLESRPPTFVPERTRHNRHFKQSHLDKHRLFHA